MKRTYHQPWVVTSSFALVAVMIFGVSRVSASPLTNPSGAPYVKLGVYQGVVGVIGSGQSLEIGNLGTDIGSTGDLYLRPGNLSQSTSARIFSNAGKGALGLATGKICLNPSGSASLNAYTCYSSWVSSGDTFWTSSGGTLQLAVVTPQTDVLQLGTVFSSTLSTTRQAIPRRAVDVYAASGATTPAFRTGGILLTGLDAAWAGTDDAGVPYNGNVDLRGKLIVDVESGITVRSTSAYPWTSGHTFQLLQNGTTTNYTLVSRSNIDADTFDAAATLPFPTDHDLYWKPFTNGTRLCLNAQINAPNTGLCTGGALAGTPCSSSAQCGGGTCTNMCKVVQAICPKADGTTKRCVDGGTGADIAPATCTNSSECGSGNYCISGKLLHFGNDTSSCANIGSCYSGCANLETMCNGSNTALCLSGFGTRVLSDSAAELGCAFRTLGGVTYITRVCDCRLSADTPYWQVTSGDGVAQLCTTPFQ